MTRVTHTSHLNTRKQPSCISVQGSDHPSWKVPASPPAHSAMSHRPVGLSGEELGKELLQGGHGRTRLGLVLRQEPCDLGQLLPGQGAFGGVRVCGNTQGSRYLCPHGPTSGEHALTNLREGAGLWPAGQLLIRGGGSQLGFGDGQRQGSTEGDHGGRRGLRVALTFPGCLQTWSQSRKLWFQRLLTAPIAY